MKRNQNFVPADGFAPRSIVLAIVLFCVAILGATEAAYAQAPVESGARFQYSVAVDGDLAVVGAEWYDDFKGAVWVLRRNGGQWVMEQKLSPGDPGSYDHFGRTVSIDDGNIVVEAPWSDSFRGTTCVFARTDGTWIQRQKLAASEAVPQRTSAPPNSADATAVLAAAGLTGAEPPLIPTADPPPVDMVLVTNGTLEDRVEIRWTSVEMDAIVYKVLRDGVLLSVVASNDTLYIDETGTIGVSYEYCVVVKDMADQESTPVCANGWRIIFAPTAVAASDGEYVDRVLITWTDLSHIEDGYYLYRDGTPIDTTGPNTSWLEDTNAVPDVTYNYELSAFVSTGQQSLATGDTGWLGVVPPPLDVAASDGQYIDRVVITWQDQDTAELGYNIYRDSVLIGTTGPDIEVYVDSLVVFGNSHTYCVSTEGAGNIESIWVCDEGGTGLTAPGNVAASDSTRDDRVTITWDDLSDYENGYEISRALAPDTVVLDTTGANTEIYYDDTADADITYTYLVRAINNQGGVSPYGSDDGYQSIVLAPVEVSATDGAFEDHTYITWTSHSTTAVLFKIFRDGTFIKSLSVGNANHIDYGGTAGLEYEYTVAAVTALEVEAVSLPDSGSRDLAVPSSVTASDEEHEDRIVISWTDNSQFEHGYVVSRRDTNETQPDTVYTIGPNRTSFTDYNAVPGITYSYGVAAFDSLNGTVGYSEYAYDTGRRVLAAPSSVQAGDGEYEEQVEITWLDNSGAEDGYHIYRDGLLIGETADNFTTFTDMSPALGVTSEYSVAAYDSVPPGRMGESEWVSDTGYTTILAPVSFNASDIYEDRIELVWVDISNVETGYEIWSDAVPSGEWSLLTTTGPNVTSYTDYPTDSGTEYRYCVKSVLGTSLASEEACDFGVRYLAPGLETIQLTNRLETSSTELGNGDNFGRAVAISGDAAIVGALTDHWDGKDDSGSAYMFERDPLTGNWSLVQQFSDATPQNYEYFGCSVAISRNLAFVGAYGNYNLGWMTGAVYVYWRDPDGNWVEETVLTSEGDSFGGEFFGQSVAFDGNTAVIGRVENNAARGAAYVFTRAADRTWTREALLTASDGADNDLFSYSVAISGDVIVIGAYGKNSKQGAVYIYSNSEGTWQEEQILTDPDGVANDKFGAAVAIVGDHVVVGASRADNGPALDTGAAFVFEYDSGSSGWVQTQKLTTSDGATSDQFGATLAASGGVLLIGAHGDNSSAGSAYIFSRDPATNDWNQTDKLVADGSTAGEAFGISPSIEGDVAAIGSNGFEGNTGTTYILEIPQSPDVVSASDGEFDSRVRITWDDISSNEHGFRISRDGEPIASVATNVEVYEDFDAEPGRTYEYGVAAYRSDVSVELERVSDYGWRPPNGNITGRISTLGGGASEGIYVGLDPMPTKSLLFDGAGGHARVPDPDGIFNFTTGNDFTIEAWVRYVGNGGAGTGDGTLIAKSAPRGGGDTQFPFWISNKRSAGEPGRIQFSIGDGTKTAAVSSHSDDLNDNTWRHIACVHDADAHEISIYIDGVLEGITPYTGLGDITNADSLSMGAGAKGESWYGGQLDEVRIWNITRNADDIQASMSLQLSGDEADLVAYWPMDEGSRGVITDPFAGDHYGIFEGGVYWSDFGAPLDIYVQTGPTGNFVLSNLHYGNKTTFKVIPFEGNRQFEPPYTMITLSVGHPVENQVNFVDISAYTLSGVVTYDTTNCGAENISILVDNRMAGATDTNGKFAVSADNGLHSIKPVLAGHTFEPESLSFYVDDDIEDLVFMDMTKVILSGKVGGSCDHEIGDVTITIRSENGCLTEHVTADSAYSVALPPKTYLVSATVDIATIPDGLPKADVIRFFQNLGEREAVLDSMENVTLDMLYRAPLEVTIEGLEAYIPDCGGPLTFSGQTLPENLPVLDQPDSARVQIRVYENYGEQGLCPLDEGIVVIYDEIADREGIPVEIEVVDGLARYGTYACTPSLIQGRVDSQGNNRSFQKALRAMAVVEGRSPVSAEQWVLVTGRVSEDGADFITAYSNELLYILRDPPGDQSYSFVEEGFTVRRKTEYEKTISSGQAGLKLYTEYGYSAGTWFGIGGGGEFETKFTSTTETEVLFGGLTHHEKGTDILFGTKERFSTSPDERFIGEQNDVFVGIGENFIFSVVQEIKLEDCEILKFPGIGFEAEGIETMFAYTQRYIEESLIPEIESKIDYYTDVKPDETEAAKFAGMRQDWLDILDRNKSLKLDATPVENENHSFSGGTEYSFVRDSVVTHSGNLTRSFIFDGRTDLLGITIVHPGGGLRLSIPAVSHVEYINPADWDVTGMVDTTLALSKSVGYVLSDDNIGDRFTVDVKRDGIFPSLVFDVLAGASSCPYEAWPDLETEEPRMMSRDKPVLYIDPPQGQHDVPPDEEAVFTMNLVNLSPTEEARRYVLREVASSNPYGALIRANGVFINDDLVYYPGGGETLNLTVTVERGPEKYNYENLAIMAYPLCEWWLFEIDGPLNLADTVFFDVTFEAPCSDVTLFSPESGWASTAADPAVDILLSDYELQIGEDKTVTSVSAQYRRADDGQSGASEWTYIFTSPPDSLLETYYEWTPPDTLPDGLYEIRAHTQCAGGRGYSEISVGTIDRHAPVVFGTPEPADGDLSLGEDISVTFNETIDCNSVDSVSVGLVWLEGPNAGLPIPVETGCNGSTIVLMPTASDDDLEGWSLEASVHSIRDVAGNAMTDTVAWVFDYRRSRFAWNELYLVADVPYRNPGVITAELANGTGESVDFTVTEMPTWITDASPSAGTILPGQTQNVVLALDPALTEGTYEGRIEAETGGTEPDLAFFDLHVTVSCHDPDWIVNPNSYEHSMTMVAGLTIEGAPSDDVNDRLAAFVGDQLRGVSNIELVPVGIDNYAVFLTVYSNRASGETMRFQIWDDDNCKLYNATVESYPFVANGQIGSPGTPVTLTATEVLADSVIAISVQEGWNWFSTNIRSLDMSATSILSDLMPASGDIVKSQTAFSQFVDETTGWAPVLLLDNVSGYMLKLSQSGTILHTGATVPVDSALSASQGWNWIGYLPDGPIATTVALDDLRVQGIAQDNDIIKSQDGFAQYVASHGAWYGSLDSMRTGEGYKLYLDAAGTHTFNYPVYVPSASPPAVAAAVTEAALESVESDPSWSVDCHAFQHNMTVTAVVRIGDTESSDSRDRIGAFVGDQCRGVTQPVYIDGVGKYLAFLLIHSNAAIGEEVRFRVFDADAGVVYDIEESVACGADAVEGTVLEPIVLNTGSVHDENADNVPTAFGLAQNVPNPFNPETVIRYDVPAGGGNVTLRIYDVGGRLVRTLVDSYQTAGWKSATWQGQNDSGQPVATGVYFYRMTAPGFNETRKMLLLK